MSFAMSNSRALGPTRVILESGRESSLRNRHPWVFSGAIRKIEGSAVEGELVEVYSNDRKLLASGHWGDQGLAVRVLAFEAIESPRALLRASIGNAFALRKALGFCDSTLTTAFRLVNAEGDGLPGLVVDLYDRTAVVQCHSKGMQNWRSEIVEVLQEILGKRLDTIVDRSPGSKNRGDSEQPQLLLGVTPTTEFSENGIVFGVDCLRGQKTGFFLDQRDNRAQVERRAAGRTVLNAFCYTGGFTLYALRGGAASVHSVDVSAPAMAELEANLQRNSFASAQPEKHTSVTADCMEYLKSVPGKFDLIVLDPPAFVKHQGALRGGLSGYETINTHAIRQIAQGGLLYTFSCSQFVTRELFRKVVFKAAARSGRSASSGASKPRNST